MTARKTITSRRAHKVTSSPGPSASPGVREFTLILEDLRSQFMVFVELLAAIRSELREFASLRSEQLAAFGSPRGDLPSIRTDLSAESRCGGIDSTLASKVDRGEVETIVARAVANR